MQGSGTGDRLTFSFVRSEDMLVLDIELRNLDLDAKRRKLRVANPSESAWLVVNFPPQHVAEQASPAAATPADIAIPVPSRLSGPSRLVFRLRGNVKEVDFDPRALLAWGNDSDFEVSVVPDARRDEDIQNGIPDTCSAIEMPLRLFLSSDSGSLWHALPGPLRLESPDVHVGARQVVTAELWHARLVPSASSPARRGRGASVRAIGSPYYDEAAAALPFEWLPRAFYRDAIRRTHRAELDPSPLLARHFLLSSLGAWLDLDGPEFPSAPGIALERWMQRTAFGQDELVVTEAKGHLLPTGHAASLVTVRRRRLSAYANSGVARAAVLLEHLYVKVAEAEVDYGADRALPLRRVRLRERITPPLAAKSAPGQPFWIEAGDPPARFRFTAEGDDWRDEPLAFTVATMFVPLGTPAADVRKACDAYAASGEHRTSDFAGQLMDAAPARTREPKQVEAGSDDHRVEALALEWQATPVSPQQPDGAAFATRVEALEVRLPALHGIVADDLNRGWFTLRDVDEEANVGAVFLESKSGTPKIYLNLAAAGVGTLVVPSMQAGGISRTHGIVGDVAPLAGGAFDPATYFAGPVDEAVVLGDIPLREVLPQGELGLEALPTLLARRASDAPEDASRTLAIHWKTAKLTPDSRNRFLPKEDAKLELDVQFAGQDSPAAPTTRAVLSNYVRNYEFMAGHSLQLGFGTTVYEVGPGRPPRYEPGFIGVGVSGLLLELAQALIHAGVTFSRKNETTGREFGFSVEYKNDRIDVVGSFQKNRAKPKPSGPESEDPDDDIGDAVPWGATLLLRNIAFEVKVSIFPPFLSPERRPTEIGIAFASPTKPFFVSSRTGIWGGGGSLAFVLAGVHPKSFTFSLAFGAFQTFAIGPAKGSMLATIGFALTIEFAGPQKDEPELKFAMIVTVAANAKLWEWLNLSLSFLLELSPHRETDAIVFLGTAKVTLKVKVLVFSVSLALKFDMRFAGPAASDRALPLGAFDTPLLDTRQTATFTDTMSAADWQTYRAAFAAQDAS